MLTSQQLQQKQARKIRRRIRVRGKISGTKECPRVSVFRSSKHIVVQLIDDERGATLAYVTDVRKKGKKGTKTEIAKSIGEEIAKVATSLGVKSVVFDRGGLRYHGRVKAVAEGVRASGITM